MEDREFTYYEFLITLSKLFEKEGVGYTWYDGQHLTMQSMYAGLYENYLFKTGKPFLSNINLIKGQAMKEYKRKRLAEYWCTDEKPKDIKKHLNSSERWRGKRDIQDQLKDVDINEVRFEMEIEQSDKCYENERTGFATRLGDTLENLGLGSFNLYKCTCENLDKLSDEEVLKRSGHL